MDIEAVLRTVLRQLLAEHRFRLPVTVATVARNGAVLFTRYTAPGAATSAPAVEQEHITGNVADEGFLAPIHMLATDATGRIRVAIQRRSGDPVILETADPEPARRR